MKPARTLAPAAAPVGTADVILSAVEACVAARSHARLERELQAYLGVEHVFLVSSGKAALTLTLQALHALRAARRVVIPAYTCFSVPAAVIRADLEPLLVDVDPATLDFDEGSLRRALQCRDVLCVVPTHLFGVPSDVERVRALAPKAGVFVVEDAAQALGVSTTDGRRLGSIGDAGVFSLGRGKHLTAGGGGIIATSSASIAKACGDLCARLPKAGPTRALRVWVELALMSIFIDPRLYWLPSSLPFLALGETIYEPDFRLSQLPATSVGALRRWRRRLEQANGQRESASQAWARELGLSNSIPRGTPLLRYPVLMSSDTERASLIELARRKGLGVSTMYPSAIHRIPDIQHRFGDQRFPGAEALAARLVTLPTHGYVQPPDRAALSKIWGEMGTTVSRADPDTAPASC